MKFLIKIVARFIASNEKLWSMFDATVGATVRWVDYERRWRGKPKPISEHEAIIQCFPDLTVRHGIFTGLRYPRALSLGSALFPKLLGTYEQELHSLIRELSAEPYSEFIDVGCAEGYYAVGFAKISNVQQIFAFDTDPNARKACRAMAHLNGVEERVQIGELCDASVLMSIPIRTRALILSDCEGYERELFTSEVIKKLVLHDILIEVHDEIDPEIPTVLKSRFASTHELTIIASVPDGKKAELYQYPELERYTLSERRILLAERQSPMEWFFFRSRTREVLKN